MLRAAGAVVVTSTWTARRVVARHDLDPARVHVAVPGVDPAPLAPGTDGAHRLLCLGAVTPTKGQDLLVSALAGLGRYPWTCDLVGPVRRDPAFVADLRARITDLGLADRLVITGPRTGAALEATFAAADLLVVPSRIETSGMAAAEALARGIPVLAADVGGLPETLDGAGFLITAEDVGALGAALRGWFAEPCPPSRVTALSEIPTRHAAGVGSDGGTRGQGPATPPLTVVLRLLVGLGLPALLVARLGADDVVDGLDAITPGTLLAALLVGLATTVASAARWCLVARGVGLTLPLREAVADVYRATLLNSLLPAGVLGDVHRAVRHHRRAGDGRGARAVVLERVAGQVVVVIVSVGVLVAAPALLRAVGGPLPGVLLVTAGAAAVVAVAALGAWLFLARRAAPWRARVVGALAEIRGALFTRRTGPGVVALSLVALAGYLGLFVVAARAAGVTVPLSALLPLVTAALLAMSVPLTVGGWGPREAAAAVAFGAVGLAPSLGLAVAVVYGVLSLVSCLPGLAVLLLDARRSPNAARLTVSVPIPWRPCSPSSATARVRPMPGG